MVNLSPLLDIFNGIKTSRRAMMNLVEYAHDGSFMGKKHSSLSLPLQYGVLTILIALTITPSVRDIFLTHGVVLSGVFFAFSFYVKRKFFSLAVNMPTV